MRAVVTGALVALIAAIGVAPASAGTAVGHSSQLLGNGRLLHPVGRLTTLGDFPSGGRLTPDGRFFWAIDSGYGPDDVRVVSVATGQVVQRLPLPGAYGAIAFAPDGRTAYVSGEASGESPPDGAVQGAQGDVVHVFAVDPAGGQATERAPIAVPQPASAGSGRSNSLPPTQQVWPDGLAVSPDGRTLVVALLQADSVAVIDTATGSGRTVSVGTYPDSVAIERSGARAFVTNEGDGTVSVVSLPGGSVVGTVSGLGGALGDADAHPEGIVLDPLRPRAYVAVANRDAVAVIDTRTLRVERSVDLARPEGIGVAPVGLTESPDGATLYAADAGEDAVAAIALADRPRAGAATRAHPRVRAPSVRAIGRYVRGAAAAVRHLHAAPARRRALRALRRRYLRAPVVQACSGPTRRQANAYVRRVRAALGRRGSARGRALRDAARRLPPLRRCAAAPGYLPNLRAFSVIGRMPTAAYPRAVAVTPDGARFVWLAAKGFGSDPALAEPHRLAFGYTLTSLIGRLGATRVPSDREIRDMTPTADRQVRPTDAEQAPAGTPVVGPGGGPSRDITHVFYIVKENRSYDDILGSDARGQGDPRRTLFDDNGVPGPTGGITPNTHSLVRTFPLLDQVFADSEVSADGHLITTGGYATDYVQRAIHGRESSRGKGYDFGAFPISFPPNHFIFDSVARAGISMRIYGEQAGGNSPFGNDGRPTYGAVSAATDNSYPSVILIGCNQAVPAPGSTNACVRDSGTPNPAGAIVNPLSRFDVFQSEFLAQDRAGTVPAFNYLVLTNDHTQGTTPGEPTPQAMVADNDYALGQMVDLISHSSIWPHTAIFVVEDDGQDGNDHVDSHRVLSLVMSPWTRRGAVVHTRYDQYSVLRTIELILGLHPLSLYDSLATPMYDAFVSGGASPDVEGTRYTAVAPSQSLSAQNGANAPAAALSKRLDFRNLDDAAGPLEARVLWESVHPGGHPPP